ncbi:MAG: hypothetical protein JNL79_09690 [Myxococcales bacterium]|nr:hypothetical protein [Myxococcales bacterium]
MRLKIILPNVLVVLLVGLLSFFVVRRSLTTVSDPGVVRGNVEHEAQGAAAVLQIQLLRSERWLFENAGVEALRERLSTSIDDKARREKVTGALNDLKRMAGEAKGVFADAPDLVVLVGKDGKAVGRNEDTQTYVGDDLGGSYPLLVTAAKEGHTGSDLWIAAKFSHKHLVSYAPIRDKDGSPLGLVAFAWSLSDGRVAKLTDGAVALVVIEGDVPKIKAKANDSMAPGFATDLEGTNKETVLRALKNSQDSTVNAELATAAAALRNVGSGDRAAIAVARKISSIESPDKILWPILAGCGLGLVFVIMAGGILGGYITEPIGRMEETLLQITTALTTGEGTNARIEIEHPELGGLATRINQLLNTVLGVEEDNTDDDGRPSVPPARQHFQEALAVEGGQSADANLAAQLAAEPEAAYYARLYREYIEAKKANGESVDGITEPVFVERIKGMERDQAAKLGRAVRYAVQRGDGKVSLLAVPV